MNDASDQTKRSYCKRNVPQFHRRPGSKGAVAAGNHACNIAASKPLYNGEQ